MSKYVALDDLYKVLASLDWQDLYLPVHFKRIVDELPSVSKDWYDEQDVRNAYTDGFSDGIHRGYEDAVHNYSKFALAIANIEKRRMTLMDARAGEFECGQVDGWNAAIDMITAELDGGKKNECNN